MFGSLLPLDVLLSYGSIFQFFSQWVLSYEGIKEEKLIPFAAIVNDFMQLELNDFSTVSTQNVGGIPWSSSF